MYITLIVALYFSALSTNLVSGLHWDYHANH